MQSGEELLKASRFSKHQSTRKDEVNEDGKQRVIKIGIDSESLKELATPNVMHQRLQIERTPKSQYRKTLSAHTCDAR